MPRVSFSQRSSWKFIPFVEVSLVPSTVNISCQAIKLIKYWLKSFNTYTSSTNASQNIILRMSCDRYAQRIAKSNQSSHSINTKLSKTFPIFVAVNCSFTSQGIHQHYSKLHIQKTVHQIARFHFLSPLLCIASTRTWWDLYPSHIVVQTFWCAS